jgi:hypothetical protein
MMGVAAKAVLGLTALAVIALTVHDQLPQALVAPVEQPVGAQPSAAAAPELEPGAAPAMNAEDELLQATETATATRGTTPPVASTGSGWSTRPRRTSASGPRPRPSARS